MSRDDVAKSGSRRFAQERTVEALLVRLFEGAGWAVQKSGGAGRPSPDLQVRHRRAAYAIQLKAAAEGRADRLVPLLAQAVLEAQRSARGRVAPLAVVAAPRIPARVVEHLLAFARDNAPTVAVGVIDLAGLVAFKGRDLEVLNQESAPRLRGSAARLPEAGHLFSDLNQWMLKVLLAPELPEGVLSAPRGEYRNASELARAADVSVMTAFRFVQLLGRDGHLEGDGSRLRVVRREELMSRWKMAAVRSPREVPMRLVLRGDVKVELRRIFGGQPAACLGLFAAAEALGLGHVHGVPTYVYVERLSAVDAAWKSWRPCDPGEASDIIAREAAVPRSIFRAAVRVKGVVASDALQVWLDVARHPSRGAEQARLIERKVLRRLIEGRA